MPRVYVNGLSRVFPFLYTFMNG